MKRDNKKEVMNALIMVFQFGINMIVPIFLCTLAGVWIGKKTGADWVTVPLFFLGAFAGANNIYRMVQKFLKPEDDGRAVRQTPGRQSTTETEISDSISRVYGIVVQLIGVWFVTDKISYSIGLWYGIAIAVGIAVNIATVIYDATAIYGQKDANRRIVAK